MKIVSDTDRTVEVIPIINNFLFLVIVAIFDGRQAYGT
jgi:hypothetical protein